jgi:hypothetical protein
MPINFPSSPTSGSQYTYGSKTWQWNGYAWDIVTPTTISTFNGCTSSAITITGTANEVTVDTTCPNIVIGLPNNLVVQNLTVTGSLLVSGGITTQFSEVVLIEDNFITLNANVTGGTPTENAGIIISRGASANVDFRWNETSDKWQFTNNGTDYWDLPINVVNTFNGSTGAVSFAVPVASSSVTGVASFGNEFLVSAAGAVSLTSNYVTSFNGSTGAVSFAVPVASSSVTGVASFGNQFVVSAAGAVSLTSNYASSVNGLTGAITIQGLTGITSSVSGQTIRLSNVVTNDNSSSTKYLAFYGVTSGSDVAKVNSNLRYSPLGNTITAYGGFSILGMSAGAIEYNQIMLDDPNPIGTGINLVSASKNVTIYASNGVFGDVSSIRLISYDSLDNPKLATITPAVAYTADQIFTLPDDSGVIALTKNVATSLNGATGAVGMTGAGAILFTQSGKTGTFNARLASSSVTGVASFGNEFLVSAAGAVSLTSNYVKSFNGSTGAVSFAVPVASSSATGVASFGNEFVVSAAGAVSLTSNYVKSFNGSTGAVSFAVPVASSSATGVASFGNQFVVSAAGAVSLTSNYVSSVNGSTGAVVSIATTGSNAFTGLQTMNAGLTANHLYVSNGATFNSRVTFLSGMSASGGITFNSDVSINSTNTLRTENITASSTQLSIDNRSNARVSIGDYDFNGNSTYIFIRDAVSQLDVSNSYGAINIGDPIGIASGNYISVDAPNYTVLGNGFFFDGLNLTNSSVDAGATFTVSGVIVSDTGYRISSSAINGQTGTSYTLTGSDNGKIVTFNNAATTTVTIPTGLPVGFNCTAIQLGTGQVGFTAASGVTMNAYASGFKVSGQHGAAAVISYSTNIFNLSGTLSV